MKRELVLKDKYALSMGRFLCFLVFVLSSIALLFLYSVHALNYEYNPIIRLRTLPNALFLLNATVIFLLQTKNVYRIAKSLAIIILLFVLIIFLFWIATMSWEWAYITPLALVNFLFLNISIVAYRSTRKKNTLSHSSNLFVLFNSFFSFIGYLYQVEIENYFFASITSMSLLSIINFGLLIISLSLAQNLPFTQLILGKTVGGNTIRKLLPIVVLLPLALGFMEIVFEKKGYFDYKFGNSFIISVLILLLSLVIFYHGRKVVIFEIKRSFIMKKLKERELLFNEYVKNIDVVFWRTSNLAKNVIYLSPAFDEIWGFSRFDVYVEPSLWMKSIIPEDRQKVAETFYSQINNANSTLTVEYRIKRPDGTLRVILDRGFALRDSSGDIKGTLGIATDITDFKLKTKLANIETDTLSLINKHEDIESVGPALLRIIGSALDFQSGELWLEYTDKRNFHCLSTWTMENSHMNEFIQLAREITLTTENNVVSWLTKEQKILALTAYTFDDNRKDLAIKAEIKGIIVIPVISVDEVIAILFLYRKTPFEHNPEVIKTLEKIAKYFSEFILHSYSKKEIKYLEQHDVITGFLNRKSLELRLEQLIAKGQKSFAIVLFDINRFRTINEIFGHEAGDAILQMISAKVKEIAVSPNLLASVGDKFIIPILNITNFNNVIEFIYKILGLFKDPFYLRNKEIFLTVGIGISVFPQDGTEIGLLLRNADLALNHAKKEGDNTFKIFTKNLPDNVTNRLNLQVSLRRAIENKEFFLVYQPKLDLESNQISGFEALLRWEHPERGTIMPGQFLYLAEETGMIVSIGEWAIEHVCDHVSKGLFQGIPVSINLSPIQFKKKYNLIGFLNTVLANTGINAKFIEFEITETMLLEANEHNLQTLEALRSMGFNLLIDDFGTGFCSLSYLQRIPAYKVKIDQIFIRNMQKAGNTAILTKSIIAMSHALGKKVTGEGVELGEQLSLLKEYGCDEIQGFYFSPPLAINEIENFIEKHHRPS